VDHGPYFFVSSAPGEDDIFVARFFHDLSDAVRSVLGKDGPADVVGYLDPGGTGEPQWPADAQAALATCGTFIALCSTRYFLSPHCGRSWNVFAGRLREFRRRAGSPARCLLAVPWAAGLEMTDLPDADDLQPQVVGSPSGEEIGVLIRLSSHRAAYRAYVDTLARHAVDAHRRYRLPAARPDEGLDAVSDAFHSHPRRHGGDERGTHVSFAVVAGTREQMRRVRANTTSYGDRREDWAPYQPAVSQPLVDRAAAVAAARRIGSEVVPLESLPDRVGAARRRGEIVVLLVDAWATQLDELRAVLRATDTGDEGAAVLVPTNYDDPETNEHRGLLRVAVLAAFPGRGRRPDLTFHPEVTTVDRFDADLAVAIVEAQSRLRRSGAAVPVRPGASPSARPILGGP
jgi:FxsC-like protein